MKAIENEKLKIVSVDSPASLAGKAVDIFVNQAKDAITSSGVFHVAIPGGSTPKAMFELIGQTEESKFLPWNKIQLFWVDERCVPVDDPASNYGAACKDFIDRVPIIKTNIHPMPVNMASHQSAMHYQKEITDFFETDSNGIPAFDLILLGIGTDGHTASLFPGTSALKEQKQLISVVKGGMPNVNRLTMTYPILNQAREVVFLASGKGKAGIIQAILEKKQRDLPALGIQPRSGKLTWLLDREAASLLPKD